MAEVPSYPSATISKLLDITDRHLRRLVTDGILIRDDGQRGRYPITNVTLYIRYLRERAFGKQATETDLHSEKIRLAKAQADRTEMEVDALKESLIRSDDVIEKWSELISNCRGKLLNTPAKIAHLVIAADEYSEVEEIIRTEIYEALNELSEQPFTPNSMESDTQDIQTTKVNEGQRVGGSK